MAPKGMFFAALCAFVLIAFVQGISVPSNTETTETPKADVKFVPSENGDKFEAEENPIFDRQLLAKIEKEIRRSAPLVQEIIQVLSGAAKRVFQGLLPPSTSGCRQVPTPRRGRGHEVEIFGY